MGPRLPRTSINLILRAAALRREWSKIRVIDALPLLPVHLRLEKFGDPLSHFGEMRSGPVNSPAFGADTIMLIVLQRARLSSQSVGHVRLRCSLEQSIAFEATREGSDCAGGMASPNRRRTSVVCISGSGIATEPVINNRVHEETTIAREDCTLLGGHDLEKAVIPRLRFVRAI